MAKFIVDLVKKNIFFHLKFHFQFAIKIFVIDDNDDANDEEDIYYCLSSSWPWSLVSQLLPYHQCLFQFGLKN